MKLVEVMNGTWVDPTTVCSVVAYEGTVVKLGCNGRIVKEATLTRAELSFTVSRTALFWQFPSYVEAVAQAAKIAAKLNGEPDGPNREDLPDKRGKTNVTEFPARGAA